ncbi:vascular endothelial growth factor D [Entelurus aequoreus]|uniref:vascular endothelial growth factor D n=1 Tax=Entelurus aequoreus TaxID=161455 RepID=UPI002B1DCA8B|nr:vascular endothelial growth factor D [Entelurus aequoreus]
MRMRMRMSLCLVTLLVQLSWIQVCLQRETGSQVMEVWEKRVRWSSSLDELLRLTNFPDWKLWKCQMRLQHAETLLSPPYVGSHRSTRYAAESYSMHILKAIDEEWQKTQCVPRETCVDVAKELGTDPSVFFKPPCVSLHRCGGCCNQEGVTCRNTSALAVNKTVLSIIPFKFLPEPLLIRVANHTDCGCLEPAIIRRHARPHGSGSCALIGRPSEAEGSRRLCVSGWIWDCASDRCIPYPSRRATELPVTSWMPDCEIDVDRCDCLPLPEPTAQIRAHRCHLNSSLCAHRRQRFDAASCRCRWPK